MCGRSEWFMCVARSWFCGLREEGPAIPLRRETREAEVEGRGKAAWDWGWEWVIAREEEEGCCEE